MKVPPQRRCVNDPKKTTVALPLGPLPRRTRCANLWHPIVSYARCAAVFRGTFRPTLSGGPERLARDSPVPIVLTVELGPQQAARV